MNYISLIHTIIDPFVSDPEALLIKDIEETIKFIKSIKKDIIVLSGDLGSGKTKFVQGILKHFGLENEISSPTFTIVNEYNTSTCPIYHFDVYRLADIDEFYAMGGEEYFENGICLIEWGEIIKDALPSNYIKITFSKNDDNDDYRELNIERISR